MSPKKTRRPVVYLAGPITGCNRDQREGWRLRVKDRWGGDFTFIDPTDETYLVKDDQQSYEIVRRIESALEGADGMLVNMWKESVGSAVGAVHAKTHGIPVVVADPNRLNSRILAYYADAVEETVTQAMRSLRAILRSQSNLRVVVKRSGKEEPFDRHKLVASVRSACRDAGRSDTLLPPVVVPRALEILAGSRAPAKGKVTSAAVREAVWAVLADVEGDPLRHNDFAGVREAWESYDARRRPGPVRARPAHGPEVKVQPRPLKVRVFSPKAHTTIWDRNVKDLADLPSQPRFLFQEICRIEGIAEIRFTRMSEGPATVGVRAEILASKTAGLIEGKCYNDGAKGQLQMFQIRVHNVARTEAIRMRLVEHLGERRLLRIPEVEAA